MKNEKFSQTEKIFREINFFFLEKMLHLRTYCQKGVKNCRNFHTDDGLTSVQLPSKMISRFFFLKSEK